MSWWGWMIGGAILLGAELGFVNAQFYLVFIGVAALVVGLAQRRDPALASWAQWALFAVLAVVSMVGFRSRLYRRLRGHAADGAYRAGRRRADAAGRTAPGQSCQVEYGGTFWTVRNDSETADRLRQPRPHRAACRA